MIKNGLKRLQSVQLQPGFKSLVDTSAEATPGTRAILGTQCPIGWHTDRFWEKSQKQWGYGPELMWTYCTESVLILHSVYDCSSDVKDNMLLSDYQTNVLTVLMRKKI